MTKWKNTISSKRELPFLLLLAVGIMEFLFISLESLFSYIGYYLVEDYIIVPCLFFVGIAMSQKITHLAKRHMLLAGTTVVWFLIVQIIHKMSGMGTHPIGTVLFVYLMAFPFAAVTNDKENRGMNLISWIFLGAAMVQVLYAVLLVMDCVPVFMKPYVYWDGARLHVFWHSNITACFLMIGIGFAVSLALRVKSIKQKAILVAMVVLQFITMALTNCRTTLLAMSAFFGGIVFCYVRKNNWKRVGAALAAALIITVGSFWIMSKVFELSKETLENKISQQLEVIREENGQVTEEDLAQIKENTTKNFGDYEAINKGEVIIYSSNGQGTLSSDMRTLNGRTGIWKAALCAVRENRSIALWGTEYVDVAISTYNQLDSIHTHNSWIETLMRLGVPGLVLAMMFTFLSVRSAWVLVCNQHVEAWKKVVAMMTMCVMVTGVLEPYLFITNVYYHVTDFIFFLCTGYLEFWRMQLTIEREQ